MSLKNKTALITGANAGIGFATCLLFAKEKCNIVALDIHTEINADLKSKLSSLKANFSYISCDVSRFENVKNAVVSIKSLDILVNNAGILGPNIKTENYPEDDFDKVIDINVKGVYYLMKMVLPIFPKNQDLSSIQPQWLGIWGWAVMWLIQHQNMP
jgi:NAD(P)-dependent dehydrogenase (short-subunit alcohol dehydrogenase family)